MAEYGALGVVLTAFPRLIFFQHDTSFILAATIEPRVCEILIKTLSMKIKCDSILHIAVNLFYNDFMDTEKRSGREKRNNHYCSSLVSLTSRLNGF